MVGPRKGALAEESAEVEVLFANMDKMKTLTKKIQASVNRLDASGKAVQEAISPIYGNTQKLQIANSNIDKVIEAIEKLRAPRDQTDREERTIRAGPGRGDLRDYIASLDRTASALADLKRTNLRSNENAVAQLAGLLKLGNKQLEDVFRGILQDCSREKVQPLEYVAKRMLRVYGHPEFMLTHVRESIPCDATGRALYLARNQCSHFQFVCSTVPERCLPDTHTTHICRRARRVSRELAC
jgi:exocyst complex protein 7